MTEFSWSLYIQTDSLRSLYIMTEMIAVRIYNDWFRIRTITHTHLFGASEYLQTNKGVLRTVHNWNIFSTAARQMHRFEVQFCQHLIFSWKITYFQIKTKILEKIKSIRLLAHSTPTAISHFTVISRKCYKVWQEWKGELRNIDHRTEGQIRQKCKETSNWCDCHRYGLWKNGTIVIFELSYLEFVVQKT